MDTQTVRMILRIAELGSMKRAAEEYCYTPSAFKRIADAFEEELGVRVFSRTSGGTAWNAAGEKLAPELKSLLETEERILSLARTFAADGGLLTVGTFSSVSNEILPSLWKSFRKKHADVKLRVDVDDSFTDALRTGRVDCVIDDETDTPEGTLRIPLFEDEYVAVLPPSYPKTAEPMTRETLCSLPFIMPSDARVSSLFGSQVFSDLTTVDSDDDRLILRMVSEGLGVSVLPSLTVRGFGDGVKTAKLVPRLSRTLSLCYLSKRRREPLIRDFTDHLLLSFQKNFGNPS